MAAVRWEKKRVNSGTLFGISVGPGDPELLTLKAVKVIGDCPVVAAPCTAGGKMLALDIVRGAMDLSGKEILPLYFAMGREENSGTAHKEAAERLREQLDRGRDVAMLNLGDSSLYATFGRMLARLAEEYRVLSVPGVTSFCAGAALLGISLAERERPLHLVPSHLHWEESRNWPGTKVYMKTGAKVQGLREELKRAGRLENAVLLQNYGLEGQAVYRGAEMLAAEDGYFSLVILKD